MPHNFYFYMFRKMGGLQTLLFTAISAYGLKYFTIDGSPKAFVDDNDNGLRMLSELENEFGRTNNAVILIAPAKSIETNRSLGFMFEKEQLQALKTFTEKAWLLPHAQRIDSIINHQHSWGSNDELIVESLLEEFNTLSDSDIQHAKNTLTQEMAIIDRLITEDGNYAGLHIKFALKEGDQKASNEAGTAVYQLVEELEAQYPNIDIYPSGTIINNFVTMELAMTDTVKVVSTMYLVMFVLLAILLRSALAMLNIVFVTMISVLGGLGLACWSGAVFTSLSMSSISIIITVTIAHCVHIFMGFFQKYRQGENQKEALKHSLSINLQPVFLTSLTTIVGFLSMNLSDMPPMRDLGNICAAGVLVAFFSTYTILPVFMAALPFNKTAANESKGFALLMDKFALIVINHHKMLLLFCIIISALSVYLSFQNIINNKMAETISKPHKIRDDNDMVDKHLGGIYNFQYQIAAKPGETISTPEYLQKLESFTEFLRLQPEVTNVFSYSDVIKRLNRNLNNDNSEYYRIPENTELAAQYLLLYEMSLPQGMDLSNQIAIDKTSSLLIVTFANTDTHGIIDFSQRIKLWQQENLPEYMRHSGTGYTIIWTDLIINALKNSIEGALIALLLISLVLIIVLRSLRLGVISLIPNLLPAAIGFGFWRLYSGELNFGLMMVLTITIGIVVDDTVHFLSKYKRALEKENGNTEKAVLEAFSNVGPALFITTLVLVVGFAVMVTSKFVDNSTQGLLICVVLIAALLLDFLMLPPLLMLFGSKHKKPLTQPEQARSH